MSFSASSNAKSPNPLFDLGQIVATPDALRLLEQSNTDVIDLLMRHAKGDWGVVCVSDARSNDQAVVDGTRVLSVYELGSGRQRLWIITEADRRVTTLLLPDEY